MIQLSELRKLSLHERLQLVEDLWDTIAMEDADLPVSEWQQKELDRREKEFIQNPNSGISWEKAKDIIRGHHA